MSKQYTLEDLLQYVETTTDISLLRLIREQMSLRINDINLRIEQLCIMYGQQVEKEERQKNKKIGFSKDRE